MGVPLPTSWTQDPRAEAPLCGLDVLQEPLQRRFVERAICLQLTVYAKLATDKVCRHVQTPSGPTGGF